MKKADSSNYKDWLEKGTREIEDAERLLKDGGHADTICFLAQQAAEKYLKGYLVAKKTSPKPIHNLEELAKICGKSAKDFLMFLDECLILTRYYIETRYPPLVPIEYSKTEAKKAIEAAEEIVGFIESRLEK